MIGVVSYSYIWLLHYNFLNKEAITTVLWYAETKPDETGIVHALKYIQAIDRMNAELLSVTTPPNKLQWNIKQVILLPVESV